MDHSTQSNYNSFQGGGKSQNRATSMPLTTRTADGVPSPWKDQYAGAVLKGQTSHTYDATDETAATSLDTVARSVNRDLLKLLSEGGYDDIAESVSRCCENFQTLTCENGHVFNPIPDHRCYFRLCVHCARYRQRMAHRRIFPKLDELTRRHPHDKWVMITLTVRSSLDQLPVIVKGFKASFARLRRRPMWKECIRAGVAGFEVTFNPEHGWHFHVHILALRRNWLTQAELQEEWTKATGDELSIPDIRAITSIHEGLTEVLKYVFKPSEIGLWTVKQLREFLSLGRVKLAESYGSLRGLVVEDDSFNFGENVDEEENAYAGGPCPTCGSVLAIMHFTREFLSTLRICDSG